MRANILIAALIFPFVASAMPVKSQMLKPRAYFVESDNNLLEALDLKAKTLSFSKAEFDQCGAALQRTAQTLSYSCRLEIPTKAKVSKLQNMVSPTKLDVKFGGTPRQVAVQVSPDAKFVTFTTTFDKTGIDFEVLKFNDDLFAILAKDAQLVISDALSKQKLQLEVLESR